MLHLITHTNSVVMALTMLKHSDYHLLDHVVNVSVYVMHLANYLGLDQDYVKRLGVAGMLHDVGLLLLPTRIVTEPCRVSEDDFEVYQKHVLLSRQICHEMGVDDHSIITAILQHHERLDGSGYPCAMHSEEISLVGRLLGLCDTIDNLYGQHSLWYAPDNQWVLDQLRGQGRDPKRLDSMLLEIFIESVGIYPVGSLVRLNDNRLGVVLHCGPSGLLSPVLRIITNEQNQLLSKPYILDLAQDKSVSTIRVHSMESSQELAVDPRDYLFGAELYR
ncbi:metal dependent phosphohydrolase [Magnetococcus marinus MC-1]|uniref:Metal dependent phosphohydrolase n=1 Tax=Magnetococcus marinus (strain ATCC BAA-1437 / JCM 17883 / MC-1) TaxID=156889 RepID=A0L9X0_MAGMM|nr:metal dependent phosphohydrolase [Magnetococcus marinus MC-1]